MACYRCYHWIYSSYRFPVSLAYFLALIPYIHHSEQYHFFWCHELMQEDVCSLTGYSEEAVGFDPLVSAC